MQSYARYERDDAIGCPRWNKTQKEFIFSFLAPAADDVKAFVEFIEQTLNVGGIILQVGIHRDNYVAAGIVYAGC
ncbi:MAG: hypothetical protein BWY75_03657 [bacterium ADurb.Bin425]|nr:MAG: hypothetical protein BWY75_03657 [bacterium ADurb.Bin425]